jgi:uncharacterized membrane protein
LTAALIGSLALNLFLGGILVAASLRHHGPGWHRGPPDMMALMRGHGDEATEAARAAHRDALRERFDQVRAARAAVADALVAEPFDAAALDVALDDLRNASAEAQGEFHRAFADVAATLSADERRTLAKRMSRHGGD